MVQKVFGLVRNCGDGSATMDWFRDEAKATRFVKDDRFCEDYGQNEGSFAAELEFPDSLDLDSCGFRFSDGDVDVDDIEELDD